MLNQPGIRFKSSPLCVVLRLRIRISCWLFIRLLVSRIPVQTNIQITKIIFITNYKYNNLIIRLLDYRHACIRRHIPIMIPDHHLLKTRIVWNQIMLKYTHKNDFKIILCSSSPSLTSIHWIVAAYAALGELGSQPAAAADVLHLSVLQTYKSSSLQMRN